MANYLVNDTQLTSIADAIRAKSGNSAGLTFPSGFISEIGNISSGGGGTISSDNDVMFYDDLMNDCRGGIAYSYSAAEFAKLTEMPDNPDHSNFVTHGISIPMTSQGWNWSLADAKAYVAKYGKLNIGQTYIPTDGKSHWICYVPENAPVERRNTEIDIVVENGNVSWQIDDGAIDTASGNISVTFPSVGWHDVKISAPSGVTYYPHYSLANKSNELIGKIQKTIQVFCGSGVTKISNNAFRQYFCLTSITIPNNVTTISPNAFNSCYSLTSITIPNNIAIISNSTFYYCYSLTSITIPNSIKTIDIYAFSACYSLTSIIMPDDITAIKNNVFSYCHSLASITIPDDVTSIDNSNAFSYCYSLTSITIPDSITNIGNYAFSNCYGLKNIVMKSTTPPTLSNVNPFNGLMSDYTIIVPAGSLSDYTSETNWSSLADHIVQATA